MAEVSAVNMRHRICLLGDGQSLPVTAAFDENGDDCDFEDAVVCVAGPDKDGMFLTIDLRQMEKVTLQ